MKLFALANVIFVTFPSESFLFDGPSDRGLQCKVSCPPPTPPPTLLSIAATPFPAEGSLMVSDDQITSRGPERSHRRDLWD